MLSARQNKGFTLMELMIVVAIMALLAMIAYPSYLDSVRKSARTEAKSKLTTAAAAMDRLKAVSLSYAGATVGAGPTYTMTNRSPESGTIKYNLSFVGTPDATTYVLKAASTDAQDSNGSGVEIVMINQAGQTCIATKSASSDVCAFGTDPAW
ncbi:MAG TPA: type IV pilin protein [Dongiaceae bacterium]|nr:type IV pilin protein [Dongiaceae bacterium]